MAAATPTGTPPLAAASRWWSPGSCLLAAASGSASWPTCCRSRCWSATSPASPCPMITGQLTNVTGHRDRRRRPRRPGSSSSWQPTWSARPLLVALGRHLSCCCSRAADSPVPGPAGRLVLAARLTAVFDLEVLGIAVVGDVAGAAAVARAPRRRRAAARVAAARRWRGGRRLHRQRPDRPGLRRRTTGYVSTPDQELLALGGANWQPARPGLPGQQQRQPDGDRRLVGVPHPARPLVTPAAPAWRSCCSLQPVLESFPLAALGRLVIYAATRLVDIEEIRPDRPIPAQRADPGARRRAVLVFDLLTAAARRRPVRPRPAAPGGTAHDGILGFVPGLAGMHDVDDYPEAGHGAWAGGLPLRRPAVLRQRRGLRTRCLDAVDSGADPSSGPAQHGGQRRARHGPPRTR